MNYRRQVALTVLLARCSSFGSEAVIGICDEFYAYRTLRGRIGSGESTLCRDDRKRRDLIRDAAKLILLEKWDAELDL